MPSVGGNAPKMLQFRQNLIKKLVDGKSFRHTEKASPPVEPIPHFRLTQDHFHCFTRNKAGMQGAHTKS